MTAPAEASAAVTSLIDEARHLTRSPGGLCLVAKLLPILGDELREAIDSDVHASSLAIALKKRNVDLPAQTISRHRRGDCRCP